MERERSLLYDGFWGSCAPLKNLRFLSLPGSPAANVVRGTTGRVAGGGGGSGTVPRAAQEAGEREAGERKKRATGERVSRTVEVIATHLDRAGLLVA